MAFGSGSSQFSSNGLQNGETIGSVTLACGGGDTTAGVAGSPYTITPGAATGGTFVAGNYTISYVPGALMVNKADQTIVFDALPARTCGEAPFDLTATAGPGLAVSYVSSDPTVASVSGSTVTILMAGLTTITASQPGDANHNAANPVPQMLTVNAATLPPYATWAADPAQGLTAGVNDGPLQDPDGDGISNLLEFTLGGKPMVSSQAILPKPALDGANRVFEYDRSVASRPPVTTQIVEYGGDLTGWTAVTIPLAGSGIVEIVPGASTDHVKVILPVGAKVFARLKVSQ